MSKHILSNVQGFEKRSDLFHVDPRSILVVDGWNDRTDFSGEDELMASIREIGVRDPLKVRKNNNNQLELRDGERRIRATMRLLAEGCEIRSVPVIVEPRGKSEIDSYIDSIVANSGKPLTPTEEAASFKRLRAWGLPIKEIAAKSGRSVSHVRNRLELSGATPAVKDAVDKGEIPIKTAQAIVVESDGKVDAQAESLERVKATPKQRVKRPKPITKQDLANAFYDGVLHGYKLCFAPAFTPADIDMVKAEASQRYLKEEIKP